VDTRVGSFDHDVTYGAITRRPTTGEVSGIEDAA